MKQFHNKFFNIYLIIFTIKYMILKLYNNFITININYNRKI